MTDDSGCTLINGSCGVLPSSLQVSERDHYMLQKHWYAFLTRETNHSIFWNRRGFSKATNFGAVLHEKPAAKKNANVHVFKSPCQIPGPISTLLCKKSIEIY